MRGMAAMEQPLEASRLSKPGVHGLAARGPWSSGRLLGCVCLLWLIVRFLPAPTNPPPLADAVFTSIRAGPSAQAGRLVVTGLPEPSADPLQLHRYPAWQAATHRLQVQVQEGNEELAALAARISGRVETFADGTAGLRAAGRVVVFHGLAARHLQALGTQDRDRPWETLSQVRQTLALRLEAPGRLDDLGESAERQALARLHQEIDEALLAAERLAAVATDQFRREVKAIPGEAAGPFRRRGPGLVLEIVLAALLGALLRETVQAARGRLQPRSTLFLAPVLATGVVLLLAGTPLLPVHPMEGVSRLFLPLSFALGFSTGWLLEALAGSGERVSAAAPEKPRPEPRTEARAEPRPEARTEARAEPLPEARPPTVRPEPRPDGPPPAERAERSRLPFFPRRR